MLEPSVEKDWCLPLTGFDHFADIEGSRAIATVDSKGDNLSPINNNIVAFQNVSSNCSRGGSLKCVQFTNSFGSRIPTSVHRSQWNNNNVFWFLISSVIQALSHLPHLCIRLQESYHYYLYRLLSFLVPACKKNFFHNLPWNYSKSLWAFLNDNSKILRGLGQLGELLSVFHGRCVELYSLWCFVHWYFCICL